MSITRVLKRLSLKFVAFLMSLRKERDLQVLSEVNGCILRVYIGHWANLKLFEHLNDYVTLEEDFLITFGAV